MGPDSGKNLDSGLKGRTNRFSGSERQLPADGGRTAPRLRCVAVCEENKNKRALSYGCHVVFVSIGFIFSVFLSMSEPWCPIKVCWTTHNAFSPKKERKKEKLIFCPHRNTTRPT